MVTPSEADATIPIGGHDVWLADDRSGRTVAVASPLVLTARPHRLDSRVAISRGPSRRPNTTAAGEIEVRSHAGQIQRTLTAVGGVAVCTGGTSWATKGCRLPVSTAVAAAVPLRFGPFLCVDACRSGAGRDTARRGHVRCKTTHHVPITVPAGSSWTPASDGRSAPSARPTCLPEHRKSWDDATTRRRDVLSPSGPQRRRNHGPT